MHREPPEWMMEASLLSRAQPQILLWMLSCPPLSPGLLSLLALKPKLSEEGDLHLFQLCQWTVKGVNTGAICYSILKCEVIWIVQSFSLFLLCNKLH